VPSPASTLKSEGFSGTAKRYPFCISHQNPKSKGPKDRSRSYSAANTAVTSRGLLDQRNSEGKLERATMAVSTICLLHLEFCHGRMSSFWIDTVLGISMFEDPTSFHIYGLNVAAGWCKTCRLLIRSLVTPYIFAIILEFADA
jgi:hypothetical protein